MPDRFVKKPVEIEAIHFVDEASAQEIINWIGETCRPHYQDGQIWAIEIWTLEGSMFASLGDWAIKGIKGEFYPCKPEIFEETYEAKQ